MHVLVVFYVFSISLDHISNHYAFIWNIYLNQSWLFDRHQGSYVIISTLLKSEHAMSYKLTLSLEHKKNPPGKNVGFFVIVRIEANYLE